MKTRRNIGRGLNRLGEFANRNLEHRFRGALHEEWCGQVRVVCAIGMVIVLGMGVSDYMAFGLGAD